MGLVGPSAHTNMLNNYAVLDAADDLYAGEHPLMRIDAMGNRTYYLQDPQGSTIGMANEAGAGRASFSYDSFGNLRQASGVDAALTSESLGDYRFQGMWLDPTGLYYARARSYDLQTGLFLSRDPAVGHVAQPESTAPYVFVGYLYHVLHKTREDAHKTEPDAELKEAPDSLASLQVFRRGRDS